jgi:hypothetical protein
MSQPKRLQELERWTGHGWLLWSLNAIICHNISPLKLFKNFGEVVEGFFQYAEAMLQNWGEVPDYSGRGRSPNKRQPEPDWKCIQVIKHRS